MHLTGVELWFSSQKLVLFLAAALVICAWYLSSALASHWKTRASLVRLVLVSLAVLVPFIIGPGPLDTFRRAIADRPAMSAAIVTAIVATMVAALIQRSLIGRLRVASLWALLIIPAMTAFPEHSFGWNFPQGLSHCLFFDRSPGNNLLYDALPNVALYVPAGLLFAALTGSVRRTIIGLLCLSITIELYQALFTDRTCQVADVAANAIGAAVGAFLALGLKVDQRKYEVSLESENLSLVPLTGNDARDLFPILDDARLHRFIGGTPLGSEKQLRERYEALESRHSPDRSEIWLNWVIRERIGNQAVGTVQATVRGDGAEVAWVVGTSWQGKGYAKEAVYSLVQWLLDGLRVETIVAHVHPEHGASARVATAGGLKQTDELVDGERVWRLSRVQ